MFKITCEMCGETFEAKSKLARYCEECRPIRFAQKQKEYKSKKKREKKIEGQKGNGGKVQVCLDKDNMKQIAILAKKARQVGMNYGEYVGRYGK